MMARASAPRPEGVDDSTMVITARLSHRCQDDVADGGMGFSWHQATVPYQLGSSRSHGDGREQRSNEAAKGARVLHLEAPTENNHHPDKDEQGNLSRG